MVWPWRVHKVASGTTRYTIYGMQLIWAYCILSLFIELPMWLLIVLMALWMPLAVITQFKDGLEIRREMKRTAAFIQAVREAKEFDDLPPEHQEELRMARARHMLRDQQ